MEIKKVVLTSEKKDEKQNEEKIVGKNSVDRVSDRFMKSMLYNYHARYSGSTEEKESGQESLPVSDIIENDVLTNYRILMENNVSFKCAFDILRTDGAYMVMDEDVTLIMTQPTDAESFKRNAEHVIGRPISVTVESIDEENRIVYLKNRAKIDSMKIRVLEILDSAIENNEKILVSGRIVAVYSDYCVVDIFEKGIMGSCLTANWRKGYVRSLQKECNVGEIHDFYVTKKILVSSKNGKKVSRYALDRKELAQDEWDLLKENKAFLDILENHGTIVLKCVEMPKNKTYWWGVSDSLKGIEVMCDYTRGAGKIETGSYYKCAVKQFDLEQHIIKCAPYSLVSSNKMNNAAMTAKRLMESLKKGE